MKDVVADPEELLTPIDNLQSLSLALSELKGLAIMCYVYSMIFLGLRTLVPLMRAIQSAKTKAQKMRVPLYRVCAVYIASIMLYLQTAFVVIWWTKYTIYGDFVLEFCTTAAVFLWFEKWNVSLRLFVQKRYIKMLTSPGPESKKIV